MSTEEEVKVWREKIPALTQMECAQLQRFAPPGHPIFDDRTDLFNLFSERFAEVGGMTPEISKRIGWER
jgi:hypothetical protein